MNLETFRQQMPEFAKDIKLNLGAVLEPEGAPDLSQEDIDTLALSCAYSTQNKPLIKLILNHVKSRLTTEQETAAQIASTIMAMNNVYYRFTHLVSNPEYRQLPAKLRMNSMAKPPVSIPQFELYCLAISAINNCGFCMDTHVKKLEKEGLSKTAIQSAIRIAAVINAAAHTQTIIECNE